MEIVPGKGARACECRLKKERERLIGKIPPQFAWSNLETLTPQTDKHDKQARFIEIIRDDPTASFFFAGRPGTGKSLLMWTLYRHVVETGTNRVVACTMSTLLDEYRDVIRASMAGEDAQIPRLSVADLRQKEKKFSIFLDDIDKANPTDYAAEQIFGLVNAVYEFQHQLVITTNLSPERLAAQYDRSFDRGEPIVRRMMEGAKVLSFF